MKNFLFACTLIALLSSCTGKSLLLEEEKKFTPLHLYYNPFEPVEGLFIGRGNDQPEHYYPHFLNYPNDLVKHGLRGKVSLVAYLNIQDYPYVELGFNELGNLTYTGSYWDKSKRYSEIREFKYSNTGKLEGIYINPQRNNCPRNEQKFEYDASGKLTKRKGGMYYTYQTYTYYDNGVLKEIIPHTTDDFYKTETHEQMEFNKSGELIKEYSSASLNPFFGEAKSNFRSVSTFAYASNGLCTQKEETMYCRVKMRTKLDSIRCYNTYEYNAKGDIIYWQYSDCIYKDSTPQDNCNLVFLFDYEYDQHDNWTTMKITCPELYTNNRQALANIAKTHAMLGLLTLGVKQTNEKATITFRRQISYHGQTVPSTSNSSSASEK